MVQSEKGKDDDDAFKLIGFVVRTRDFFLFVYVSRSPLLHSISHFLVACLLASDFLRDQENNKITDFQQLFTTVHNG